jgi:hypothetical protein
MQTFAGNVFLSGFPTNEHIRCILVYVFILIVSDNIESLWRRTRGGLLYNRSGG